MNLPTLAEVRKELWKFANDTSSYRDSTQDEKDEADSRINRVVQRFFELITPARCYRRIDVPIYDETITLPRATESLLGLRMLNNGDTCCTSPYYIYSRFHEFAERGPFACCRPIAQPVSETAQTFRDPESGFKLRLKSTQTEGSIYRLIGGTDTNDDEYFDEVELAIENGTTTTTRQWNSLPRFQKDINSVAVQVFSVDSSGTETLLAIHAPGETSPAYQRYSVPNQADATIARILTRLCFVKLTSENDLVFPGSFGALQKGLQALRYEETNDRDNAASTWADALQLIDSAKDELEGGAEVPSIRAVPGFACSGIPCVE